MNNLKDILTDDQLQDLEEAFDKALNEGEKTLAAAVVRNTEKSMEHEVKVLARLYVKLLFWNNVASFSDDKLSNVEDSRQAREKAMNAVKNITRSAANEKPFKILVGALERAVKAQVQESERAAKKSDYENIGI